MEKLPPKEKVYEAWTAIADGRVRLYDNHATVISSNKAKEYTITFKDDVYSSNDNGTFWQGYAGYPVLAVMMLQGLIPLDKEEAMLWKNIDWNAINKKHKNNYTAAVEEIEVERNINKEKASAAVDKVMAAIKNLQIKITRKI